MSRPILLDLYCGGGGAAVGYHRAGFDIVGVDAFPQPTYPFPMVLGDATTFPLEGFDAIHASPPCKAFTALRSFYVVDRLPIFDDSRHPDCLTPTLERFAGLEVPWVVENVPSAPMPANSVTYCGSSFGLPIRRHRLFASNVPLTPPACRHDDQTSPVPIVAGQGGGFIGRARNRSLRGVEAADAMGVDWTSHQAALAQMIPPAYTTHIGHQLMAVVGSTIGVTP